MKKLHPLNEISETSKCDRVKTIQSARLAQTVNSTFRNLMLTIESRLHYSDHLVWISQIPRRRDCAPGFNRNDCGTSCPLSFTAFGGKI